LVFFVEIIKSIIKYFILDNNNYDNNNFAPANQNNFRPRGGYRPRGQFNGGDGNNGGFRPRGNRPNGGNSAPRGSYQPRGRYFGGNNNNRRPNQINGGVNLNNENDANNTSTV
jgi:hypothetical protein